MKQQLVMDELTSTLSLITTLTGYNTDIGDKVYEWSEIDVDTKSMPFINVRDIKDTMQDDVIKRIDHTLTVVIDVVVYGDDAPSQARGAFNDVMKVLGTNDTLNGLVDSIVPVPAPEATAKMQANQTNNKVMVVSVAIEINYNTAYWDT